MEKEAMEPVEYSTALQIIADLILVEYEKRRYNEAFALVHALAKLTSKVGLNPSDFVSDEIRKAIVEGPRRLHQQLADPASEVTPELFVAGIRKALLEPHTHSARPAFEDVIMEMWAMQRKKGADYGNGEDPLGNLTGAEEYNVPAWLSCILRMDDKRRRIASFVRSGKLYNEGPDDAFFDLAVYAVHGVRLFREWLAKQAQRTTIKMEFEVPDEVIAWEKSNDTSKLELEDPDEVYSELDSEEGLPIG